MLDFDKISNISILCIGDIMLDKFVYGKVSRISPEAPVPVFQYKSTKEMLGGCGNVVANLATLGCKTKFIGIVGNDLGGRKISSLLPSVNSHSHVLKLDNYSTIIKTRFIAGNNHILRVDNEKELPIIKELLPKYKSILEKAVKNVDIVLLSDYKKGLFTKETTPMIIDICKKYNKKVIVDPKGNEFSKYNGVDFVKPNLKEFREATGMEIKVSDINFEDEILKGAKKIFDLGIKNILLTLSEHGMIYISSQNPQKIVKLPTQAKEVFDVSGAGDTTIAVFTLAFALGLSTLDAMKWANSAAGIVVGKVGTACVTKKELDNILNPQKHEQKKILSSLEAKNVADLLKSQNKIVGFTNGCFDILHLGHINSFKEAKKYCDCLIVGINTDASVKRLKGSSRPWQDEKTRSEIVASLDAVDYVVLFDDDTALPLIQTIKPNVIAKQGYEIQNWPEAQFVNSYGGKAVVLPELKGVSTTNFLEKIKGL